MAYSEYLQKYIMTGYNHGARRGYWLSFSDDGINWSKREWIQEFSEATTALSPYQSVMAANGSDNGSIDREFYIYSAFYREFGGSSGENRYMYLTKVSLNKDAAEELQKNSPTRDKERNLWGSVTDFSDIQGKNDWFYMQNNETSLYYMGYDANTGIYGGAGSIGAKTQSSPFVSGFSSARVWSAPRSGVVRISGSVKKEDISDKNNAEIRILLRNRQLLPETGRMTVGESEIFFDFTASVFDYDIIVFETSNPDENLNSPVNLVFDITVEYLENYDGNPPLSPVYEIKNDSVNTGLIFSNKQNSNGMSYRSWNGKEYGMLDWNAADSRWEIKNTFTLIGNNWQHPDALDSVRTWTAPYSGTILVTSDIKCASYKDGGDGITASVRKNGEIIWGPMQIGSEEENETADCTFRVEVTEGDTINFIVNKNKTVAFDTTTWSPLIKY